MTPYYEHAGITIYHGDCVEVMRELEGRPFDLTLTDPPYNYGLNYGASVDDSREDYAEWCREWWTEARRLSKAVVVFPGNGNLPVWWEIRKPSAVGCWYKPGNARSSVIGWEEWEPWLYWAGDKAMVGGSSVIKAPAGKQRDTGDHPCPKPLSLMRGMLGKFKRAEFVLDPFMGSGSTLRAAKDLGRRAVGIEIEERFCELAASRLEQEVLAV